MLVFTIEFTLNSYNCFLSLNFLCSPFKIVLEVVKVDLKARKRSVMCRIRVSTIFKGHICLHGTWFHTGGYGWWKCEQVTKTYVYSIF